MTSAPKQVIDATKVLNKAGFTSYMVGGCVRDILMDVKPKDWDITTNAKPEQIISLFPKTYYENEFGTVGVVNEDETDQTLKVIEITPYRKEGNYSDQRHPDDVKFCEKIEDDLSRRDFTINAIAMDNKGHILDPYKGQYDILDKTIRCVGDADKRLTEDALRILRAVRFTAQLSFMINIDTEEAILTHGNNLKNVSKERIRDEFIKLISCENPRIGLIYLRKLGILKYIIPELEETYDIGQNKAHSYDVWNHLILACQCTADKDWPLNVRLAALFHDVGKPRSRRWSKEKNEWTFYGHEVVGAKMTKKILSDLKFPKKDIEEIVTLVRWHMFFSDTEQITISAVRRMIANVGKDHIWDLMNIRVADRVGTGRPKENPYRLRKYKSMIDEALHDPISVGMIKLDGKDIIDITKSIPSPRVGHILNVLLEDILDDPIKNDIKYLTNRTLELNKLSDEELKEMGKNAKKTKEVEEDKKIDEIRKKHWVR